MVSLIHAAPGDTAIALPRWEPACQRKSDTFVLFASRGLNTATSPQIVLGIMKRSPAHKRTKEFCC